MGALDNYSAGLEAYLCAAYEWLRSAGLRAPENVRSKFDESNPPFPAQLQNKKDRARIYHKGFRRCRPSEDAGFLIELSSNLKP